MAGMLPGVEAARRRRFHQASDIINGSTRRSSLCLYVSSSQSSIFSLSSTEGTPTVEARGDGEELEAAAREAKQRLDRKLQNLRKSKNKGSN